MYHTTSSLWQQFRNWLGHKLDPHCEHCQDLKDEQRLCLTCEVLKIENARLLDLINKLTDKPLATPIEEPDYSNIKPIAPRHIPWHVKRSELEANDRAKAKSTAEAANAPKSDITAIEELEDEVLNAKV